MKKWSIASAALAALTAVYLAGGALVLMMLIDSDAYRGEYLGLYLGIAASLLFAHRVAEQHQRDRVAQGVARELLADRTPQSEFATYLRPFIADGAHVVGNLAKHDLTRLLGRDRELETFLQRAIHRVDRKLDLVGLARKAEQFGFGRIEIGDDDWKRAIARMLAEAKLVIVVLSDRPGTAWEIEQIMEGGWSRKAIFLQPPMPKSVKRRVADVDSEYDGARKMLRKYDWNLPPRSKRLRAFYLNDQAGEFYSAVLGWETGYYRQIAGLIRLALKSATSTPHSVD